MTPQEAVARTLYARWCTNCDSADCWEPEWDKYEAGESLNGGYGLTAENFRVEAAAIAPYDTVESVGRRLCWQHCLCVAFHKACKSPNVCEGLEDWQQRTAEAVIAAVRELNQMAK